MDRKSDDFDNKLRELLEASQALLNASVSVDISDIGKELERRQKIIDELKHDRCLHEPRTAERQSLIDRILLTDKSACRFIQERTKKLGLEMSLFKKKSVGLLKYKYGNYNLLSGQMLDRKK